MASQKKPYVKPEVIVFMSDSPKYREIMTLLETERKEETKNMEQP